MKRFLPVVALALLVSACTDSATAPVAPSTSTSVEAAANASATLGTFVAVGTSISMGWASDGVVAASQRNAWPAQLARMAGVTFSTPFIGGTGCRAPMAAPLASGVRTSGEPVTTSPAAVRCDPLLSEVRFPIHNLAMSSATTYEALFITPQTRNDPFYSRLYALLYPANTPQFSAAFLANPTFMAVEFGANEVLGARDGRAITGVNLFPFPTWQALYSSMVGAVQQRVPRAVLVGLIKDVGNFPAFRRGAELWNDREAFLLTFNVQVLPNCQASPNLVSVPFLVPATVAAGLNARARGLPPIPLSCAGGPPTSVDYILDPSEVAIVNAQLAQMNAHIRLLADQTRFAYFELESLYGMSALKPRFNVKQLMLTATPYTSYISLDGFHPSALGQNVLARAAAAAINKRYAAGIALTTNPIQ